MDKIKVTAQQRANAIEARNVLWPSVRPEQVTEELGWWFCDTQACFGGWCATHPFFTVQGLRRRSGGVGVYDPETGEYLGVGDRVLFGDDQVFNSRDHHWADNLFDQDGSDHELVTHRLNWLIANSEVVDDAQPTA